VEQDECSRPREAAFQVRSYFLTNDQVVLQHAEVPSKILVKSNMYFMKQNYKSLDLFIETAIMGRCKLWFSSERQCW
jgi:hypothetical protein